MRRKFGILAVWLLCGCLLFTACAKENQESPFTPLEDPSSSTDGTESHPFASTSSLPSNSDASAGTSSSSDSASEPAAPEDTPSSSSAPPSVPHASSSAPQTEAPAATRRSATVRADGGLRLRAIANENGEKLLVIPDGTLLECTEWKDGWAKTTYNGQTGYVSATYLLYNATVRADGGLRLRKGAGESFEKLDLIPDGTSIQCLEQKDGWIKTTYNNLTGYVSQEYVRVKATVSAGPGLNLREKPDETSRKLLTIPNGAAVECVGNQEDGWAGVSYNGYSGYVSSAYLAFD